MEVESKHPYGLEQIRLKIKSVLLIYIINFLLFLMFALHY